MEKYCAIFLLCDPGWYVHKPNVQYKWDGNTHTTLLLTVELMHSLSVETQETYSERRGDFSTIVLASLCFRKGLQVITLLFKGGIPYISYLVQMFVAGGMGLEWIDDLWPYC